MFENLRQAFREAVDNFKEELNRDEVPEIVDGLLRQMEEELTDAQAQTHTLEEQVRKALQLAEMEGKEAATCRRRETMARKIGDEETAQVAAEFAVKHEKSKRIQEQKALALRDELEMKRGEIETMLLQFKEAKSRRASLSSTAGRADARNSISEADDLFAQLDRIAEEIDGEDYRREAEREVMSDLNDHRSSPPPRGPSPEEEAEAKLRELKRLMGKE